jgi:hypothetical protein
MLALASGRDFFRGGTFSMKSCFTLIAIGVLFVGGELLHADDVRTVMLSGQSAPGTDAFFGPNQLGGFQINNAGQAVIRASIGGGGVNSTNSLGIWTGTSGSLELVARTGDEAPEVGSDVTFNSFGNIWISDSGRVGFEANLQGTGVTFANDRSLWTNRSGSLAKAVREGDAAPGTAAGVNFTDGPFVAMFNGDKFAFYNFLTGPGVMSNNRQGLWSEGSGSLSLVARNGSPDPETGDLFLTTNHDFEGVRLNGVGQLAFTEGMGAGSTQKIWFDDAGSLSLIAGTGGAAPGTGAGVTFQRLYSPILNDVGKVAFRASLTGTGITTANDIGIWTGESGSLTLRVREGQQAPGLLVGVTFSELREYPLLFNDEGHLAFTGRVTGPGITSSTNFGIWSDASGEMSLVARTGDPAPGLGPDIRFEQLNGSVDMNDSGQLAFSAVLYSAQSPSTRFGSIWAHDSQGELQLVALSGEQIDVDNGPGVDLRTISGLSLNSINDVGQVAFTALADGADGFFVSNAVASADFDHDGDVDGRDFLVWQRGGSPAPRSEGNLALWQEQYAAASGGLTAAVQVPEPGACVLLVILATLAPLRCALRCRRPCCARCPDTSRLKN